MALSLFDRGISIHWAPRWVDAHYESASTLSNFMHLMAKEPLNQIRNQESLDTLTGRLFYKTHCYTTSLENLDDAKFYVLNTQIIPIRYNSLNSLLSNLKDPCVFLQDNQLYLANFDIKEVAVGWISASLNVSGYVADLQEDGYFILKNENGDEFVFDYAKDVINDTIYPRHSGNFYLYYPSIQSASAINTSSWVELGGLKKLLVQSPYRNLWHRKNLTKFDRRKLESNTELQYKLQCYYLSQNFKTQVASLLGEARIGYVAAASGLSLSGQKVSGYSFYNYDKENLVYQALTRVDDSWYLNHDTSNYIEVITDFGVTSDFSNAAGVLSVEHPTNGVSARYIVTNYTLESSGNFFTSITSNNLRPTMVVLARNVLTSFEPKLISKFLWDLTPIANYESTTFI